MQGFLSEAWVCLHLQHTARYSACNLVIYLFIHILVSRRDDVLLTKSWSFMKVVRNWASYECVHKISDWVILHLERNNWCQELKRPGLIVPCTAQHCGWPSWVTRGFVTCQGFVSLHQVAVLYCVTVVTSGPFAPFCKVIPWKCRRCCCVWGLCQQVLLSWCQLLVMCQMWYKFTIFCPCIVLICQHHIQGH